MAHFNDNIKNTSEYKEWCAANFGKQIADIEFYEDEAALKSQYSQYTWEDEKTTEGDPKPINEVINKVIKTTPDGKLMVIK